MEVVEYGGTVIEALSTDTWPEKPDGWFLKALDTGESFIRKNGIWENINLGLAFIKATKSGRVTTDINGEASVVFNTPFINEFYTLSFSCRYNEDFDVTIPYLVSREASGFSLVVRDERGNPIDADPGVEVSWLATRDYNP